MATFQKTTFVWGTKIEQCEIHRRRRLTKFIMQKKQAGRVPKVFHELNANRMRWNISLDPKKA